MSPPSPSDTARWERLKALFADAMERPEADQPAFLDAACADDPALRAEVAALLAARPAAERALDGWAAQLPSVHALAAPPEPLPPLQIGPYRLVREVGRGGMGTVFLAERADGQYRQRVALKLLRTGAASPEARRRFRTERQILAHLTHPHIARLLDGGVTPPAPDAPDGLPYLVMEYVEGEDLLTYCDARRLGVTARLDLFAAVCDAVQAAHQALVVHRDLKPGNVLVTADGQVKLLDFGIAKLLGDDGEEGEGVPSTRAGVRPMTPAYAAPEQVRGEPVTTATDVYALGVLLYELLTGQRPWALEGRTPAQVERLLERTEPARPSTALVRAAGADLLAAVRAETPARLARRLRGDLDTIVLTALRREPARRYPSAAALADDLRRHRRHLPVHARPDTLGYRAGRFARRYRVAVAAAVVVALAVLGGAGVAAWQARLARAAAQQAEATLTFLQNTLYAAEPLDGNPDATIRAALDSAAARAEHDLAGQPLVAASVHSTVGYAYFNLGLYDRAEYHQRRSAALYAAGGRRHRLDHGIELLNLALTLDHQGRPADAVPLFEQALPLVRARGTRTQQGSLLNAYANALDVLGRTGEAERHYREAIALWRAERAPQLPLALNNLAILYENTRRTREAVPLVEEAVRALRAQGAAGEGRLAPVLATLGSLYDYAGRPADAAATHDEALALLRRTLGPEHPTTVLNAASRALVLRRAGRLADALAAARDAFAAARRALDPGSPVYAHAAAIYGHTRCAFGPDSARAGEVLLRPSLDARRTLYPPTHVVLPTTESFLGECLALQRRFAEAEPLLVHGYEGLRALRGDADLRTADARQRLADAYVAMGQPGRAAALQAP